MDQQVLTNGPTDSTSASDIQALPTTTTAPKLPSNQATHIPNNEDLPRWRLYLLTFALGVTTMLVALDASVLGPSIPAITSDFGTLNHIGWYSSAYLLTLMPFQLVLGRLLPFYEPKLFYMSSVLVFETGSILCATSPTSAVFICARALAGIGAGGITAGGFGIIGHTPMRERPRLMALFMALQSVAYTAGPTMGGALTDSWLTWRFNFWINLPIGFGALVFIFFAVKRVPSSIKGMSLLEKVRACDPVGAVLLIACLGLLFVALEWGGSILPYSSPQVWGCFLGSGLLAIALAIWQVVQKENGVIPARIYKQRTVALCCIFSFFYGAANMIHITLLPTYMQTVHNITPTLSGVYQLPLTFSNLASIAITGNAISIWGHYVPFLWTGPLVYLAGSVLFHRLRADSTPAQYIGYQVPVGAGFGIAIHSSLIAVQVVTAPDDMPVASGMEIFSQQLGRSVGISVAQSLFIGTLQRQLQQIPSVSLEDMNMRGAGLGEMVVWMQGLDVNVREAVREALNGAATTAFILPVAATAGAAVATWFVERKTIDVGKGQ